MYLVKSARYKQRRFGGNRVNTKEQIIVELKNHLKDEFDDEQYERLAEAVLKIREIHGNVDLNTIVSIIRNKDNQIKQFVVNLEETQKKEPLKNKRFCASKFCDQFVMGKKRRK